MSIASIPSAVASWNAPDWATAISTDEDAVIYAHLVGTVPSGHADGPLPILLMQRDELSTDENSCHVKRAPATVLVHGAVCVTQGDLPRFIELLQEAVNCFSQGGRS